MLVVISQKDSFVFRDDGGFGAPLAMRNQNEQKEGISRRINPNNSTAKDLIRKKGCILMSAITATCLFIWKERCRKLASILVPLVSTRTTVSFCLIPLPRVRIVVWES